jgi:hypothetical protein
MPDVTPDRIRRMIGELDRRIARVELQVGTATGAATDLQRAGLFDAASTRQLVAELWQLVDRLKALREGWAELHATLTGEAAQRAERRLQDILH